METLYSKQSEKFLGKLNAKTALRVKSAINKLPEGDVKKLKGFASRYRLRVGDLRIEFSRGENQIIVEKIDFRGNSYMLGVVL